MVSPQTDVIAPSTVLAAPDPGSSGTLRLSGDVAVAIGDVLASGIGDAAPYGFLVKATSVRHERGETLVDVVPATLLEALPEGHIDESFTFTDVAEGARADAAPHSFSRSASAPAVARSRSTAQPTSGRPSSTSTPSGATCP